MEDDPDELMLVPPPKSMTKQTTSVMMTKQQSSAKRLRPADSSQRAYVLYKHQPAVPRIVVKTEATMTSKTIVWPVPAVEPKL